MLKNIVAFEIRYWLRSWMLWIFTLVIAAAVLGAVSSDHVTVGESIGNTMRNAPFAIQNFYAVVSLLTLLMAAAFANGAAVRDFTCNTHQIIFSTPLRKSVFLARRFLGAMVISVIPMLGVSIGVLLAKYMPWVDADRFGPVYASAHVQSLLVFAIPNAFFMAAVLFAVAVLTRSEIVPFAAALALLTGDVVADNLMQKIDYQNVAALLDPFAIQTFALATKYWTVAEKNTMSVGLTGLILWNRLLWIAVGALIFLFAASKFDFTERQRRKRTFGRRRVGTQANDTTGVALPRAVAMPPVTFHAAPWAKLLAAVRIHFLGVVKSTGFIVILLAALLNVIPGIALNARQGFGNNILPVTYGILDIIAGTMYMFTLALITYYSGVLVWKDRETHMDEIADSLPTPDWISYASRFIALIAMVMMVQALALIAGVVIQAAFGYYRFQMDLYLTQLFVWDGSFFLFLAVLAFFIHVLAPDKYVGYFLYIGVAVFNFLAWRPLNVATYLVRYGQAPRGVYSDFFGNGPYQTAWNWFTLYWFCFAALLAIATVMFWPRGRMTRWNERTANARLRFSRGWKAAVAVCFVAFVAAGAWIYYNTKVLNELLGPKDMLRLQADYEKAYKPFANLRQPRLRSVQYSIDLFPETRNMTMRGEAKLENPYAEPLSEIHFTLDRRFGTEIEIPGATLAKDDRRLYYRIYRFAPVMAAGETRVIKFTVKSRNRGFENTLSTPELVSNGTFFNNSVGPHIGYSAGAELTDPNDRRTYGLGEQQLMPLLERNCVEHCRDNYLADNTDWVDFSTVISTAPDQIAVAPGSLVREWRENGRRYFEYKLDHSALGFVSFLSARYEVARGQSNGVKTEIYYDPSHPWNVPRMTKSLDKSLEYFTANFGPYYQKQARILEFPRVARFAQAFAGTMPYSESIGFIANLNHPDDIDMVYYVVAHEMAHQWWAHQVIGANMQGATFLSESLAQYSALMVMEKEYGRDIMRKFLRYEMDNYLKSRGKERLKERPLITVEAQQGYIHYRKASVALYYLKEMIGEEAVNRALRKLIQRYAYAPAPYPVSWVLVDALKEETPPELQYLMKDLFEDITLFSNRTTEATARKGADGKYDVTVAIDVHKFKAGEKGAEAEVAPSDWIEIGAFAKPEKGSKYGKTLHRERVYVTRNQSTYTFQTGEMPDEAGVDPFLLLVDRFPDDNLKKVTNGAVISTSR